MIQICAAIGNTNEPYFCTFISTKSYHFSGILIVFMYLFPHICIICVFSHLNYLSKTLFFIATWETRKFRTSLRWSTVSGHQWVTFCV